MKRSIDVIEHAGEIMKKVNDAVLLTTKKDGQRHDHQLGRYGH